MLEAMMKHGVIFYVMGIAVAAGIVAKVISQSTARKMVKAASEIQKSNHRFMRLLKSKFEHASMVSDRVQNVGAFVDKYMYEFKVLGVRLETWRNLHRRMLWLTAGFGICGILGSFKINSFGEETFQYISVTAVCLVVLISVHIMNDEKGRLIAARNYIVEYLENTCVHRYEKMGQVMTERSAEEKVEAVMPQEPEAPTTEKTDQEIRIRAILEEFLA